MTFIAPLRLAVLYLCVQQTDWDLDDLAILAGTSLHRARQFALGLRDRFVLVEEKRRFRPGCDFTAWQQERPKSRPGGNRHCYQVERKERDAHYMEDVDRRRIIGAQLKRARTAAGYTQEEIAIELDLDKSFVCRVENGNKGMSAQTIARVNQLLGTAFEPEPETRRTWGGVRTRRVS